MAGLKATISTLSLTAIATAPIKERQLISFDHRPAGLNARVLGVSRADAETGEAVNLTAIGITDMVAGAVIAAGDELISGADGLPIPKGATTDANVFGYALNPALTPGARVAILIR